MLSGDRSNLGWVTVGVPGQTLGLELEAERFELNGKRNSTFGAQYSLTGNAFTDIAPAVSVGVRDLLNDGREGRAFFVAATKSFGLSRQQEHLLRDWKLHLGYGTSRLDGAYVGLQGRFTFGFTANAEYVARRFNAAISWPATRYLNLKVYTLDHNTFFGASFLLMK